MRRDCRFSRTVLCAAAGVLAATGLAGTPLAVDAAKPAGDKPVFEVWDEEVPIMGHLAVAMDGTVLLFKEQRDEGVVFCALASLYPKPLKPAYQCHHLFRFF